MKRLKVYNFCLVMLMLCMTLSLIIGGYSASDYALAGDVEVTIFHDDVQKESIELYENGKERLTSVVEGLDGYSRNWQILIPNSTKWVNVQGKTQQSLDLTYSLIKSLTSSKGLSYVRLAVQSGENIYYSNSVEVVLHVNVYEDNSIVIPSIMNGGISDSQKSDTEDEDLQIFSIVINYIFDNGGIAFEPYGASVAKGSNFVHSVTSPDVAGYAPFRRIDGEYVDATVVNLEYYNIQDNITINVIYEPTIVDYNVHHHLQHVEDDDYSLHYDYITTGKGLTGSIVPDGLNYTEDELPGFKALAYEKLEIAADGSTVVEIRYDRNYYLIDFVLSGGYGVEPIYTRFGAEVGANVPIRHGYLFDGWELVSYGGQTPTTEQSSMYDINSAIISVPAVNLVYRARWKTQLTTYTMVFWRENANDNGFSFWADLDKLSAMSGSTVSGSDRIGEVADVTDDNYFTYNDALTDKNVIVEGDGSTIVNVYYTRNRYTITFKSANALCLIPENHIHDDSCYQLICGKGHVHTDACSPILNCTVPEHTAHTEDCIICGQVEHTHSASCCGLTEHTHVKGCYRNVSGNATNPSNAPTGVEDGYIHSTGNFFRTYYIYISGSWYRYTGGNVSAGDIVNSQCGYVSHTHGTSSCNCELSEHVHSSTCYSDVIHTHGENCYKYSCGANEHTHVDECKVLHCSIPANHTHSSNCTRNSSNVSNTIYSVTRKYEESIADQWPITDWNGNVYDQGQRWTPSGSTVYSQVLVYVSNMTGDDFTLTLSNSNNDTYTMHYYLEALPSETENIVEYGGRRFIKNNEIKANYNYITREEDFFEIPGYYRFASSPEFNSNDQIDIDGGGDVYFYYGRDVSNKLEFRSNGIMLDDKSVTGVMYGDKLKNYYFEPDYPASLEPNAFFFDGWYTTPNHYDGTEVDWDNVTMPDSDITYYAKWSPITHTVDVYLTADLTDKIGETQHVSHGSFANTPTEIISNGNYIFQGWFYSEVVDGKTVEKAFTFTGIPVIKDLKVYAKWSSHVSVNYTIKYILHTTKEEIAETLEGTAIAGHNKTFYAKAGEELFDEYKSGYYPLTNSHTVTMSAEEDHEYSFEYVYVESMPYAVRYIDENGNKVFEDKKVYDNNLSVVTETFQKADKKMPDAYQKRLVLVGTGTDSDGDGIFEENVITFNYNADEEHAYYKIVHYIQNIAGDGYREYRSEELIGVISHTYTINALNLTGFTFKTGKTMVNGASVSATDNSVSVTLTSEGLLIEMYYDRDNVIYYVNYIEQDTGKVLHTQKQATGLYGEQVVEYAVGLTRYGYVLVSDQVKVLSLSTNAENNVIDFYYKEGFYSIKYEIVGLSGSGSLSQSNENVNAVTGVAVGSKPIVNRGYHFVGWYYDELCTKPVDSSIIHEDNHIIPVKDGIWKNDLVFYAKIDPNYTTLTINATGAMDIDPNQTFLFTVIGTSAETNSVHITVAVKGNSSVVIENLHIGNYSITEITDWSFRYTPDSVTKNIVLVAEIEKNTITFVHSRSQDKWLDGNNNN